jgi:hypothetical protein
MLLFHFSPRTVILQKANALVPRQGCWPFSTVFRSGGPSASDPSANLIGALSSIALWSLALVLVLTFKLASSTRIVKVREKLLVEALVAAFRGTLRKNETEKALWKTDNVVSAVH